MDTSETWLWFFLFGPKSDHTTSIGYGHSTEEDFVVEWKRLVEHYSGRELSNPEEKLLALSAVARKISNESGNEYVAGIWKHAIPRFLMWRPIGTCKRHRRYIAPSWSWASLKGQLQYLYFSGNVDRAKVVEVSLESLDGDMFTSIPSGYLRIRGPARRVLILPRHRKKYENRERLDLFDNRVESEVVAFGYADVITTNLFQNVHRLHALLLLIERDQGLILEEIEADTFRRLGSLSSVLDSKLAG
jgi:hypothetical protein